MDAVVLFCDDNEIDTGSIKPLISKSLKEKIKLEAIDLKLIKEKVSGKLPV
jgi:hypothetical protein